MTRTIIVRRNYAHFIKKYSRSAALLVIHGNGSVHMCSGQRMAFWAAAWVMGVMV